MKKSLTVVLILITIISCKQKEKANDADIENFCKAGFSQWNKKLSYVIMTDIFSPPVCSRIYVYPNIAAYEALLPQNRSYKSYGGRLNGLEQVPQPSDSEVICYPLSAT